MTKQLLGHPVAEKIYTDLARRITLLHAVNIKPKLVIFLVGHDKKSEIYVNAKIRSGTKIGLLVEKKVFPEAITLTEIQKEVDVLNVDPLVHGIIVQLPLPSHLNAQLILDLVQPAKDVDGLTTSNKVELAKGKAIFAPATALGALELIDFYNLPIKGATYAVFGQGQLVGKPLSDLLEQKGAQVVRINSKTADVQGKIKKADIVVSAVGKPEFLTKEFLGKRLAIIDIGLSEVKNKMVGDIEAAAKKNAQYSSPVIGGVGPLTVASLIANVVTGAERLK